MSEVVKATELPAGRVPSPLNKPWDAPTIYVDGLFGASSNGQVIKIQLVEHFPAEDDLHARHVLNLVIQTEQFLKLTASMNEIAAGMTAPEDEASE